VKQTEKVKLSICKQNCTIIKKNKKKFNRQFLQYLAQMLQHNLFQFH
jgi:hypothetical protein